MHGTMNVKIVIRPLTPLELNSNTNKLNKIYVFLHRVL